MDKQSDNLPAIGARFRLSRPIERFPHFRAEAGAVGTVVEANSNVICLHMDEYLPGAEDWDNEIVWTEDDDEAQTAPSATSAFYRDAAPASRRFGPTRGSRSAARRRPPCRRLIGALGRPPQGHSANDGRAG
jgi:hypothetical protein